MNLDFLKADFLKKVLQGVILDVEENYAGTSGDVKKKIAIKAARAILSGFGIPASEEELGKIIDGLVAAYNLSKRFKKKAA